MGLRDYFKKKAAEAAEEDKERKMRLERDIIMALRQVYDPEIPVNVYDLGLIYEIKVDDDHNVYVQMTLTAPNCPMADYVVDQVKTAVEDVPGVVSVKIDLVFEPVWTEAGCPRRHWSSSDLTIEEPRISCLCRRILKISRRYSFTSR